jgi:DNA-directed RNA polymerase specialized sigma24 family protein
LSERQAVLLFLRYQLDRTFREIATTMSISEDAAKKIDIRIRRRLRAELAARGIVNLRQLL